MDVLTQSEVAYAYYLSTFFLFLCGIAFSFICIIGAIHKSWKQIFFATCTVSIQNHATLLPSVGIYLPPQ